MSGCYFCGGKFSDKNNEQPIHIKSYDIDICPKCAQVSRQRWERMMASIKGEEKYIPEPVVE